MERKQVIIPTIATFLVGATLYATLLGDTQNDELDNATSVCDFVVSPAVIDETQRQCLMQMQWPDGCAALVSHFVVDVEQQIGSLRSRISRSSKLIDAQIVRILANVTPTSLQTDTGSDDGDESDGSGELKPTIQDLMTRLDETIATAHFVAAKFAETNNLSETTLAHHFIEIDNAIKRLQSVNNGSNTFVETGAHILWVLNALGAGVIHILGEAATIAKTNLIAVTTNATLRLSNVTSGLAKNLTKQTRDWTTEFNATVSKSRLEFTDMTNDSHTRLYNIGLKLTADTNASARDIISLSGTEQNAIIGIAESAKAQLTATGVEVASELNKNVTANISALAYKLGNTLQNETNALSSEFTKTVEALTKTVNGTIKYGRDSAVTEIGEVTETARTSLTQKAAELTANLSASVANLIEKITAATSSGVSKIAEATEKSQNELKLEATELKKNQTILLNELQRETGAQIDRIRTIITNETAVTELVSSAVIRFLNSSEFQNIVLDKMHRLPEASTLENV